MGRLRRSRTHKAQRDVHRAARTRVCHFFSFRISQLNLWTQRPGHETWTRFNCMTLIRALSNLWCVLYSDTLCRKIREKLERQPLDVEKPGLAQHYCVECAK